MSSIKPSQGATGFTCPQCGGALWQRDEHDTVAFECRVGDTFSAVNLWIEHCTARNRAVRVAATALAENAALARHLVTWARERGNEDMAMRLESEAASEDRAFELVHALLDELDDDREATN
jgi:two-component system chemotaxis response regulator CheB